VQQLHHISASARPLLTANKLPTTLFRRHNSTDASATAAATTSAVEAPDYLDEKELHIFQKLASELSPTKLEVCRSNSSKLASKRKAMGN
jgi:hypothetical protein